ncbi:MAG: hypothetical protein AAGD00_06390 [Planctomycetota bacterium]
MPEWTSREDDPWAHRKGEPRVFALLWSVYLMVASMLTLFSTRALGMPTTQQHEFGVRAMLTLAMVGVCVIWPAVRLSQERPERPLRDSLADTIVVLIPLNALLWPAPLLTLWPISIAATLAAVFGAWTCLVGAWLAIVFTSRAGPARLAGLATILLAIGAAPGAGVLWISLSGYAPPAWWWHASPLTSIYAVTSSIDPVRPPSFDLGAVGASCAVAGCSLVLWAVAGVRARRELGTHADPS